MASIVSQGECWCQDYCQVMLLRWTEPKPKPWCFATFRRRRHREVL